jgi:tetratricopeptide (TPR) repeat protein
MLTDALSTNALSFEKAPLRLPQAVEPFAPEQHTNPRHEPKFRAFLSYSRADAGVARRVSDRLERFRIGPELVGRPTRVGPVPEALWPIFRHDLLTRPTLKAATVAALADSAALIILASPQSVRSKHVNEQVSLFKLRHPERPVIVLIVEGTPDGPEKSSFPSALRFVVVPDCAESLGDALLPDLCEGDGLELAIAKVVGRLIGLAPQEVYHRAERTRRRRGRIRTATAAALAVVATASGVFFGQSHQQKVAWAEVAALVDRYITVSPTQTAVPGARESLTEAITGIMKGAAKDPRYAKALELLKVGKITEAEQPLSAVVEDEAKRASKGAQGAAAAYRNLGSIAAISDPAWARELYAEASRLDPSNIEGMFRNGWFQQEAGQLDVAEASYRRAITANRASNNEWALWARLGKGDIERERGHLDDALATYSKASAIAENLAQANPGDIDWQYDLGTSNERIGDLLMALGNHAQALKYYQNQEEILSRLDKGDPGDADRQRDRGVAHIKVGNVPAAQNYLSEVLTTLQSSLAHMERLAKGNLAWQRDLAVSYERIGNLQMWQDNMPGALKSFSASLDILDPLVRVDPGNAGWQRDLAVSYVRIGDALAEQYDLPGALKSYQASLAIAERLATADPQNARLQSELSEMYGTVGDVLKAQGNLSEAMKSYQASLAIVERLTKTNPG